jgi:hypothetical protein
VATQRTWQRFGDFGTSNNGENTSASGTMSQYVMITPNSGRGPAMMTNGLEITNHSTTNQEPGVVTAGPNPSAGPNGTMALYHNGALIGTNAIHPDVNLRTASDNNNWLGRSQWPDPIFEGSYNEFRIYDTALNPEMVRISFANGPNGAIVPEPGTIAMLVAAIAGGFLAVRRKLRD